MKLWCDEETFSSTDLRKHSSYRYAEGDDTEIMLFSFAIDDAEPQVLDFTNGDELPDELADAVSNPGCEVWFHNGDKFDYPVAEKCWPSFTDAVPVERRRDTMVQAYMHGLPGALHNLCEALGVSDDKAKSKRGRALIQLFCVPRRDGGRNTRRTHPVEWFEFKEYAKQDIVAMRECHRKMPTWNMKPKQLELWYLDQRINRRGMQMDVELAQAAIRATEKAQKVLANETYRRTGGRIAKATQRDAMLRFLEPLLAEHDVLLPDMRADTLERRIDDPNLPIELRELMAIRLQSTTTSVAKFRRLVDGVNSDGRLRGTQQWRGAPRTGRVGHRMFQPGNMPRPTMEWWEIELAIQAIKLDGADMVFDNVMEACSNCIRSSIIPAPGKKLVVADLSNIEGRFVAWLAGEETKLQAFREYDTFMLDEFGQRIPGKKKGEWLREGPDLYVRAYLSSFNLPVGTDISKDDRQIGKVQELMFGYGGGVGAWITGAATYGIDLAQMTEQVWDVLPKWAVDEASSFLAYLYGGPEVSRDEALKKLAKREMVDTPEEIEEKRAKIEEKFEADKLRVRFALTEKTFVACDAIKRMWRVANPEITSFWKEVDDGVRYCIGNPGETITVRKVKIRRDGAWLRVMLPSGRYLCYAQPKINRAGDITYAGLDGYSKQWRRIKSYGGKFVENFTQAGAADQLFEPLPEIEEAGYAVVLSIHDEFITETPDEPEYTAEGLSALMCRRLEWNGGLPLAAAGYETKGPYKKE